MNKNNNKIKQIDKLLKYKIMKKWLTYVNENENF